MVTEPVGASLTFVTSMLAVSLAVEKCCEWPISMICKPLESSATKAVLPSAERVTPRAQPVVAYVAVRVGLAGLLTSMICKPLDQSATKAVLPSAERVTSMAEPVVS